MVLRENLEKKYALISVYDKRNLNFLCKNLKQFNYNFISTGSTSEKIRKLGYRCIEVSKITKFKEILNGRVKTLNPKIYGSLLFVRDSKSHVKEFKKLNVPRIDIVVINLYPFEKFLLKKDHKKIIEMIDIGGPSLLRAASKNFKYITAVSSKKDYSSLIKNLKKNDGNTDLNFRKKIASKVFKLTSSYDKSIFEYLNDAKYENNKVSLRYGENPNQKSHIISQNNLQISNYKLQGKEISFNNIIDIDSAYKCLKEFAEPTCVIVKHTNPCGVASANNIHSAFKKAYKSDSKSAFGGVVLINRALDKKLSEIISESFFEVISAPEFTKTALNILSKKKNLILLKLNKISLGINDYRSTIFGTLYQDYNSNLLNKNFLKLVSNYKTSNKNIEDLVFGLKVVKHLKSNAIALVSNKQTVGLGIGQTNRVDSLKSAITNKNNNFKNKNFVCISDGFFPFTDSIKILKRNNCKVIAQPGGSINDRKIINFSNQNKLSLFFMKYRLFKH